MQQSVRECFLFKVLLFYHPVDCRLSFMFYHFDQFPGKYQIIHSVFKAEQLQ